jgi:hypothetical protein
MEKLSSSPQQQFERFCCPQFTTRVFRVSVANDRAQLSKTALAARAAMGKPKLKVLADRGYFSGPEILACDTEGIAAYVPKPSTPVSKKKGSSPKPTSSTSRKTTNTNARRASGQSIGSQLSITN